MFDQCNLGPGPYVVVDKAETLEGFQVILYENGTPTVRSKILSNMESALELAKIGQEIYELPHYKVLITERALMRNDRQFFGDRSWIWYLNVQGIH